MEVDHHLFVEEMFIQKAIVPFHDCFRERAAYSQV